MKSGKPNRTKTVVEALGIRVASGQLGPGALLPSETELEREFSVSRTVIREATKMLSAKGLVTVRQRHGTRVNPRQQWTWLDGELIDWLSHGRIAKAELLAFAEAREIIEPGAAALAATRASVEQRKAIAAAYSRMEAEQAHPGRAVAADKAFHLAILDATQNPVLQSLRHAIESILDAVFPHTVGAFADNLESHKQLAGAIERGDAVAARAHMQVLLGETTQFLENCHID